MAKAAYLKIVKDTLEWTGWINGYIRSAKFGRAILNTVEGVGTTSLKKASNSPFDLDKILGTKPRYDRDGNEKWSLNYILKGISNLIYTSYDIVSGWTFARTHDIAFKAYDYLVDNKPVMLAAGLFWGGPVVTLSGWLLAGAVVNLGITLIGEVGLRFFDHKLKEEDRLLKKRDKYHSFIVEKGKDFEFINQVKQEITLDKKVKEVKEKYSTVSPINSDAPKVGYTRSIFKLAAVYGFDTLFTFVGSALRGEALSPLSSVLLKVYTAFTFLLTQGENQTKHDIHVVKKAYGFDYNQDNLAKEKVSTFEAKILKNSLEKFTESIKANNFQQEPEKVVEKQDAKNISDIFNRKRKEKSHQDDKHKMKQEFAKIFESERERITKKYQERAKQEQKFTSKIGRIFTYIGHEIKEGLGLSVKEPISYAEVVLNQKNSSVNIPSHI